MVSDASSLRACQATCQAESKCHFFAFILDVTCARYTIQAGSCTDRTIDGHHTSYAMQRTAPAGYAHVGLGFCSVGYYAGWEEDKSVAVDEYACAAKCSEEADCTAFSLVYDNTCSRYKATDGCQERSDGLDNHVSWARAGEDHATGPVG